MTDQPTPNNQPAPPRQESNRARLLLAGGLMVGLLIAGGVALAVSGGSERKFTEAPSECVEGWNSDEQALFLGRHQFNAHRYQQLEVLSLDASGAKAVEGAPGARCAIVFAAAALDPEASSAVQVQEAGGWVPLSRNADSQRLGELQAAAQSDYNAILQPDGTVDPL